MRSNEGSRRPALTSFVIVLLFLATSCVREDASDKSNAEISAFLQEMNAAVVKLDQAKFASYFAPDNVHVFNGKRSVGLAGLEHKSWDSIASIKIEEIGKPDITLIARDTAVVTSERRMTVVPKTGPPRTVEAVLTALIKRGVNRNWQVVQSHESTTLAYLE